MEAPAEGGIYTVGVTSSSNDWTVSSSADWITYLEKTASGFTFNVASNTEKSSREAFIYVILDGRYYTLTVTQAMDIAHFKGAVSEKAREIVLNTSFVTKVTSDTYTQINETVGMLQMQFNGQEAGTDYPVAIYLYEIDLSGNITLAISCADNNNENIKSTSASTTTLQTIRKQFAAMQADNTSWTVLGGVNGDFFRTADNNLIQGICYRNGVCLKDSFYQENYNTVFAIKTDGTAMIMNQGQYASQKSQIKEAVGGRQRLLAYGAVYGSDSDDYQPRTAVGVSEDGMKVYLLVVDGRDESWSYGASYYDLAGILIGAGAWDAINLDGGGSSVFVRRVSDDGSSYSDYSILNRPKETNGADTERAVPNGIAIVKK